MGVSQKGGDRVSLAARGSVGDRSGIRGSSAWAVGDAGVLVNSSGFPLRESRLDSPSFFHHNFPAAALLAAQIANTDTGHDRLTVAIQRSPESVIAFCPRPAAFPPTRRSFEELTPPSLPFSPFDRFLFFFRDFLFLLIHSTSPSSFLLFLSPSPLLLPFSLIIQHHNHPLLSSFFLLGCCLLILYYYQWFISHFASRFLPS
ncbi:uncharacterized protein KD926_009234 [Aspergillus affinis]|uniref:uncharacterized protein n=1 Tax=Aspergillus affinis TaxID=1070780 RepID=UPI0022FDFC87|nr:uncharacterized protein KD926_009234 [Aspergillus affinis]KAI9039641.1 hypothetical protein KD926_009234 [Aspergillus affinis]